MTSKQRCAAAVPAADGTIEQCWPDYLAPEHDRWDRLFERSWTGLQSRACPQFLEAAEHLRLSRAGIPDMAELSDRLEAISGWRIVPVAGLVADEVFFGHLANRRFPAGAFIRQEAEMDYLEEPDVFHDIFGHVPLLADPAYADFMVAYGKGGLRALRRGQLHNLARLYWYTIEFGLIDSPHGIRIFGAGIMSSAAESRFAIEDVSPHRVRFDLERIMRTKYIIDDFQQVYFVIDDFQQLLDACAVDFAGLYDRVRGPGDFDPDELTDSDRIVNRGTLEYFRTKHGRGTGS